MAMEKYAKCGGVVGELEEGRGGHAGCKRELGGWRESCEGKYLRGTATGHCWRVFRYLLVGLAKLQGESFGEDLNRSIGL